MSRFSDFHPYLLALEREEIGETPRIVEYSVLVEHSSRRAKYKGRLSWNAQSFIENKHRPVTLGTPTSPGVVPVRQVCKISNGPRTYSREFTWLRFFATNHGNAILYVRRTFLPDDSRPIYLLGNVAFAGSCLRYVPLDHPDVIGGALPVVGLAPWSATG